MYFRLPVPQYGSNCCAQICSFEADYESISVAIELAQRYNDRNEHLFFTAYEHECLVQDRNKTFQTIFRLSDQTVETRIFSMPLRLFGFIGKAMKQTQKLTFTMFEDDYLCVTGADQSFLTTYKTCIRLE